MAQIDYFVPGVSDEDDGLLLRLRSPVPPGAARVYAEAYTGPGDSVLVPYCQGAPIVADLLSLGRQVLAQNFDPIMILIVETTLNHPPSQDLDAVVVRIGDTLKQGVPLRRYLEALYATTCPACLRPAVASHFIWDREQDAPVAKYVSCAACAWDGESAVDPEDLVRLAEVPAQGMHYHYVLDRVAGQLSDGGHRTRLEGLLQLYSPRNLYALAELTLKIEGLVPPGPLHSSLLLALLVCLDRCSSLSPASTLSVRRRGLSRPRRFLERNVWFAFEEAVARIQNLGPSPTPGLAGALEAYQSSPGEYRGFVSRGLVRDLPRVLPLRSARLILTSPPPLDSAAWVLSYFWGGWLLGEQAVEPLRPLLRQRTPDPSWYARVMGGSFRNLLTLLRDQGHLVLILLDQRPAVLEALLLAAARSRLAVSAILQCGADYRLDLVPALSQVAPAVSASLDSQIREVAYQACAGTIRARGEPVLWRTLHAAIMAGLAERSLLVRVLGAEGEGPSPLDLVAEQIQLVLDDPAFQRLRHGDGGEDLWWLAEPAGAEPPLCDRVEYEAYHLLQDMAEFTEEQFSLALFQRFPGFLTPEASLLALCLRSLCRQTPSGLWQLRPEESAGRREAERKEIIDNLLLLGQRLGFRAEPRAPFDVAWYKGRRIQSVFCVRWQAFVGEPLALAGQRHGASPYLVIPGGRAALVSYKLAHNPLWQQAVRDVGWSFIKYRHVRELLAQPDVDEYALQTIVGLDPIVEQERAQLALF